MNNALLSQGRAGQARLAQFTLNSLYTIYFTPQSNYLFKRRLFTAEDRHHRPFDRFTQFCAPRTDPALVKYFVKARKQG